MCIKGISKLPGLVSFLSTIYFELVLTKNFLLDFLFGWRWEKIPISGEKYEKTKKKHLRTMSFLKYSGWNRNYNITFHIMRRGWDNVTHFQRIGFLNISGKANVNMLCQKYGKHIGTHKHSEVMGFVNI